MESSTGTKRKFEGPVQGIAVNVHEVANMTDFTPYKLLPTSWRARCMELLNLGGFPACDMFPHSAPKSF